MFLAGFSFITAVCIIYLLTGLNLVKIIGQYEVVKYFIGRFALTVGLYSLVKMAKEKHYNILPKSIREKLSRFTEKSASIPLAFALGATVSTSLFTMQCWTLLDSAILHRKISFK